MATIILRNRLRQDGYVAETAAVYDAQQAVGIVRARAKEWNIDPQKIGMMGFSAGAELVARAALFFDKFDTDSKAEADGASAPARARFRGPDLPGPDPVRAREAEVPRNIPAFIATAGSGDAVHAVWADEFFSALLKARIRISRCILWQRRPRQRDERSQRHPFGTWRYRFIDWFRDLGFLGKPWCGDESGEGYGSVLASPPATK